MKSIKKYLFVMALCASSVCLTAESVFVVDCIGDYAAGMLHETDVHDALVWEINLMSLSNHITYGEYTALMNQENIRHSNVQANLWTEFSNC